MKLTFQFQDSQNVEIKMLTLFRVSFVLYLEYKIISKC